MRVAVAGSNIDAAYVLGQLQQAGLFVGSPDAASGLDAEFRDLHRAAVERSAIDERSLALPVFVGDDVWFRMRHLARLRDLKHENWGFTDPRLPLVLGVWKYVAPDLRVLVTYRAPDSNCSWWVAYHRALTAFVRAHPDDCLVLPMRSVLAGFPVVAELNRRFGSKLDEAVELAGPSVGPTPETREALPDRVQETLMELDELATPWSAPAETR